MNRRLVIFFLIAAALLIGDQVTKQLIVRNMAYGDYIVVINGFLNIVYVTNQGGAWGVGSGSNPGVFMAVTIAALILIIFYVLKLKDDEKLILVALSTVCGGALGNLIDRVRQGAVVDFIDVHLGKHHWPSFNVADICITVGAVLLIIHLVKSRGKYRIEDE
jgi:signal peptidase II